MGTENTDELTVFDRTEAYKKNVEPLVKKIKNECTSKRFGIKRFPFISY